MEDSEQKSIPLSERSAATAAKLRALREQTDRGMRDYARQLEDAEKEINRRVEEFIATYKEEAEHAQSAAADAVHEEQLAEFEQRIAALQASFDEQIASRNEQAEQAAARIQELEEQLEKRTASETDDEAAITKLQEQCQRLEADLAEQRTEYETLAEQACETCEQTRQTLAEAEQSLTELREENEAFLELNEQFEKQQETLEAALAESESKREKLVEVLEQTKSQIADLQSEAAQLDELGPLQQKFDLALADAQKLKKENASLREELAVRPEANEQESAELISIRAERDQLAQKITELERQEPTVVDEDLQQQLADLQRRFELSVEDVRTYKQEAAELREQLDQAKINPLQVEADTSGAGFDWAAQKAQLIAKLDQEAADGEITSERQADRLTVEDTIRVTDQLVAEKDRQLTELREQLEQGHIISGEDQAREQAERAVLDVNELIQQERVKLEKLQGEWEDKIRQSELELSVERAKLARERAKLEEQQSQLPSTNQQAENAEAKDDEGQPKRRWLAALGLREDKEGQEAG